MSPTVKVVCLLCGQGQNHSNHMVGHPATRHLKEVHPFGGENFNQRAEVPARPDVQKVFNRPVQAPLRLTRRGRIVTDTVIVLVFMFIGWCVAAAYQSFINWVVG